MFHKLLITTFQKGNPFNASSRAIIVISVFNKHFKGKIFTNGN